MKSENLKKNFVARYGGKFDFLFPKEGTDYYSIKSSSNLTSEGIIQSEIEREFRKSPYFGILMFIFIRKFEN